MKPLDLTKLSGFCHVGGDQIKKHEMGGACVTYGGEKRCIEGCGGEA